MSFSFHDTRQMLQVMKLWMTHIVFLVLKLVQVIPVPLHFMNFPLSLLSLNLMWSKQHVLKMIIDFINFFMLFFKLLLFLVELLVQSWLKLFLDSLVSVQLSLVVHLASDFAYFESFMNEFILFLVSLLKRIDVIVFDIVLVVHDHLIILKFDE